MNLSSSGRHSSVARGEAAAAQVQSSSVASEALAQAIASAKQSAKKPDISIAPDARILQDKPFRWIPKPQVMIQAVAAAALVGAGWLASYTGTLANREAIHRLEAQTSRSEEILSRLAGDLEAMRGTLTAFKEIEHTASTTSSSGQAKLADKVERLTVAVQKPEAKLAALEGRLERMESQIMTSLAGLAAKPAAPAAAPEPPREEAPAVKSIKSEPVDGWILREVYNGAALIESRNRRLYEVMPGGVLPGVGRIESIERRGARWVVLTDKGIISTSR
jgi:hypothetical protein